jgi:hypothetical protein
LYLGVLEAKEPLSEKNIIIPASSTLSETPVGQKVAEPEKKKRSLPE